MVAATTYNARLISFSLHSGGSESESESESEINESSMFVKTSRDSKRFDLDIAYQWRIHKFFSEQRILEAHMYDLQKEKDNVRESFSLETEMDLVKRASELTQIEETLTMRVRMLEEDVVYAEEEAETTLKRFYETDHASELLTQTSKELIIKIKMLQFNLKGSLQREAELKNELLKLNERVKEQENTNKDLTRQITEAENKAVNYDKVVSLEQELCDVRVKLQHAEACCEANEEEKSMFLSTIKDMGNVIDDLKKKVTQAEIQTDNMEDRCIQLSEANAELKKELKFAKGKVKNLETCLNQMEEAKNASAKDINLCSEFITDLVMQMKLERERLQKQISSLKHENKILVNCLNKKGKDTTVKENEGALSTDFEVEAAREETVTDSTEVARDIDARQLKTKDILLVFLILIIPLIGVLIYQTQV